MWVLLQVLVQVQVQVLLQVLVQLMPKPLEGWPQAEAWGRWRPMGGLGWLAVVKSMVMSLGPVLAWLQRGFRLGWLVCLWGH